MRTLFRPLVVLGLVAAIAGTALAECVSDDLTPEQEACCAAMAHQCGAAGVEMGCCPTEPRPQDRALTSGGKPELPAPAILTGPFAVLSRPCAGVHAVSASSNRGTLKLPERPTYLLLSVFLI